MLRNCYIPPHAKEVLQPSSDKEMLPFVIATVQIGHAGVQTGHLAVVVFLRKQHISKSDGLWNIGICDHHHLHITSLQIGD